MAEFKGTHRTRIKKTYDVNPLLFKFSIGLSVIGAIVVCFEMVVGSKTVFEALRSASPVLSLAAFFFASILYDSFRIWKRK